MGTPEAGAVVGGKYRIVRPLGQGGMGTVYEAEHTLTLKRAAVKWLHPRLLPQEDAHDRLVNEARATCRIRHRNVVDVYDVVIDQDAIFLVMELLTGEPLSALAVPGKLMVHELVALLLPAMRGLAAAHAVGVVHRDVKPDNIFLAREPGHGEPVPKIIDFGISKMSDLSEAGLTRSGMTMGTPKYVSYEQLLGARHVDARADVYSFGVILYEALTGAAPYDATTFGEQAVRFATQVPPRVRELRREVPAALEQVVQHAIEKERSARLPSLSRLADELEPFANESAYPAPLPAFPPITRGLPSGAAPWAQTTQKPAHAHLAGASREPSLASEAAPLPRLPTSSSARRATAAVVLLLVLFAAAAFALRTPAHTPRAAASTRAGTSERALTPAPTVVERAPARAEDELPAEPEPAPPRLSPPRKARKTMQATLAPAPPAAPEPDVIAADEPAAEAPPEPASGEERIYRAGKLLRDEF